MVRRPANASLLVSMLEAAEDATVTVALNGTVQAWSGCAERLYGYSAAEITGQSLKCLVPLYEWPSMEAILAQAAGGNLQCSEIVERLHKFG